METPVRKAYRRIILAVFFSLCLPALGQTQSPAQSQKADDPLEVLRTEPARLMPYYGSSRSYTSATALAPIVNEKVQAAVIRLVEREHGNLDLLASKTLDVIMWKQWPKNTEEARERAFERQEQRDPRLRVNYRRWLGKDGQILALLQNSYWSDKYYRVASPMYTVLFADGKVTTAPFMSRTSAKIKLPEPCEVFWSDMDPPEIFLGFLQVKGGLPRIFTMNGPYGQVLVSTFYICSYDREHNGWVPKAVAYGYDAKYFYDEERCELRYRTEPDGGRSYAAPKKRYLYKVGSSEGPIEVDENGSPVPNPAPPPSSMK